MINFKRDADLTGLRVALAVEAAGQWHLLVDGLVESIGDLAVQTAYEQIMLRATPETQPTDDSRYLRLLVDAAAALHGMTDRSAGWHLLGVKPSTGRRYLGAESDSVPWPVYYTALCFGLGHSGFTSRDDYARAREDGRSSRPLPRATWSRG